MGIGKTIGITIVFYMILNTIFLLLYVAVGGVIVNGTTVGIGDFFSLYVSNDSIGFLAALMVPGGGNIESMVGSALPYGTVSRIIYFIAEMGQGANATIPTAAAVVGLLWVLLPGLMTGLIAGKKFSDESNKTAFLGVMIGILIVMLIPLILGATGQLSPYLPNHQITELLVPLYYYPGDPATNTIVWTSTDYVVPVMVGLMEGCLWGGFGAAVATSL